MKGLQLDHAHVIFTPLQIDNYASTSSPQLFAVWMLFQTSTHTYFISPQVVAKNNTVHSEIYEKNK